MSFFDKIKAALTPAEPKTPNDMVRDALRQHGDDGTKFRTVDHLAYFKTQHDAAAYMTFIQELGFKLEPDNSDQEFAVAFTKEGPVVGPAFEREIALITAKAEVLNGEYDGWGCPIAK